MPKQNTRAKTGGIPVSDSPGLLEPGESVELIADQILETFGDSGTARYGGFYNEEFDPLFRNAKRIELLEQMRRGDGAVKGVLHAVKSPIKAAEWRIECDNEQIKEFAETCLFGMRRSWNEFLAEALAYLDFGFYVFEKIFDVRDGKVVLVDLAPRIPRSIYRWRLDDGSFGIQQIIRTDEYFQHGMRTTKAQIPGEKLLILTNEKEGDDLTGQSILRPAYVHYQYKRILYKVQGIAAERFGVGVPWIKLPAKFGDKEKKQADVMAANMRSNEKGRVVTPADWNIEILTPKIARGNAVELAIDHHNRMILMAVLANFLDLGQGAGSYALSKDQSSFFLKHDDQIAVYLEEQIVEQVLWPLVKMNFGDNAEKPQLKHSQLNDVDTSVLATTLKTLADGGFVTPTPEIVQYIHKILKLPEVSDDDVLEMQQNELQKNIDDIVNDPIYHDNADPADSKTFGVGNDIDEQGHVDETISAVGAEPAGTPAADAKPFADPTKTV